MDDVPYSSAPRRSRASSARRRRWAPVEWFLGLSVWQRVLVGVPVAVVAFVILASVVEAAASVGRIHPGVRVAGVSVGGKTTGSAATAVASTIEKRMQTPVSVVFEDHTWPIDASSVAARLDTETVLAQAMAVGRTGSFSARVRERLLVWFRPVDIRPTVLGDGESLSEVLVTIDDVVGRKPKDASVVIEGTSARLEPAAVGLAVRSKQFEQDLLTAFAEEPHEVAVPVDFVPVNVSDSDAEAARVLAEKMMSASVTVTYEAKSWEFGPESIAKWIDFRQIPSAEESGAAVSATDSSGSVTAEASATPGPRKMQLEAFVDPDKTSETVRPKVGGTGRPAQDATFRVSNGTVTILPSKVGTGPDIEALAQQLTRVLASDERRVVELRTMKVDPEITTEDAEKMGIEERISTYTTTFSPGNAPRVNNIHTLAEALDGALVPPGGVFSFNETIGPRTAAKGYQEAPAIVNGKLVPQLGGGICQVGTTIFNAVFESGLPVVERRNHSFYISHYPKGRDAGVSWGGPDFKFKNDTDDWVLVATGFSSSSLTISLYGTDPGYEVTAEVGAWTNVKAHGIEEIKDDTMPAGARVVEDSGVDGRSIVVKRIVKKDGSVVRTDTFTSAYRPKVEVVRVGTKKTKKETTSTAN